ncbi:MAG: ABC transporter permease [Armatimonadetes bacterium]|nr:ABC transporter permease [Armatimonadota bacterium]
MRFEAMLALRHLTSNRGQTALTVGAVAVGVVAILFIRSVISGVQAEIVDDLIGSLPAIVVKPVEKFTARLADTDSRAAVDVGAGSDILVTREQKRPQQREEIAGFAGVEAQLRTFPGVRAIAPVAQGGATIRRGVKRFNVSLTGGDPAGLDTVIGMSKNVIAGKWIGLAPDEIIIGWRLADDAGIRLGDRVRVEGATPNLAGSYRVAGIFRTGTEGGDLGAVYTTRRTAQSLLGLGANVSHLFLQVEEPFAADKIATRIAAALPYKTENWLVTNSTALEGIQGMNGSRDMISAFALMASSFAIASVLIVSVVQKGKQIGILKSMGATDGQILRVFTIEAGLIGLTGSLLGTAISFALLSWLMTIPLPPGPTPFPKHTVLFPITIDGWTFTGACSAATFATMLAAVLPARRAAKLNPVEAIRG